MFLWKVYLKSQKKKIAGDKYLSNSFQLSSCIFTKNGLQNEGISGYIQKFTITFKKTSE